MRTAAGETARGAWLKPRSGGQLSQGPKPLALSQLPEATPPSAESQDRTFRGGQALPLPDPVPWKQPDLAMGANPAPCLPGLQLQISCEGRALDAPARATVSRSHGRQLPAPQSEWLSRRGNTMYMTVERGPSRKPGFTSLTYQFRTAWF